MSRMSLAVLLLGLAVPAPAQEKAAPPKKLPPELEVPTRKDPWPLRLMLQPLRRGMFIRLPVVDTDPNRGVTFGIMPIWVIQGRHDDRIRHIHAPSVTYNDIFKVIPTYRYYHYPTEKATAQFRASISRKEDRELLGQYETLDLMERDIAFEGRLQYDVDGAKRFYGIGPDTPESAESNYTRKIFHYYVRLGLPFFAGSGWKFNLGHHLGGVRLASGVVDKVPNTGDVFPQFIPEHWHQDSELQLFVDYDTRDSVVTTTRGSYAKVYLENSQRFLGSEFHFARYGTDLRHFHKHAGGRRVLALNARYEQLTGQAPFYLLPSLGGKAIFRAYGAGRYVDRGMLAAQAEERFTVYKKAVAGIVTELELAPFVGLGTVFSAPKRMTAKYFRPVLGGAVRAVARPQVVGSIDFGVGQEGLNAFMDINYSF